MNFEVSKEDWKRELRSKSPIYAAYDENRNICDMTQKVEENDTDTDSGLQSIDGDSARDKVLYNSLLEHDIPLMRQDSGLSSENSDISSPFSRLNTEQQVREDTIATKNKTLSRAKSTTQVTLNRIPAFHSELHDRRETNSRESINAKHRIIVENNVTYNSKKKLVDEDNKFSRKAEVNLVNRRKPANGAKVVRVHEERNEGKVNRNVELRNYSSSLSDHENYDQQYENIKEDRNNNNREIKRDVNISNSKWSVKREKHKQNARQESQNRILRDELFQSYKETADKITETVDQLLYKDLMCAYLTEEILNFSKNNFSVDEEMLELEEKFLENQIFNSISLLQTLETITDHQQVELKITLNEEKRVDIEISEKVLKLQHMERAFRNLKFKHAPKHLKRYCSVESLLSDIDQNDHEKKRPCDTIWDEKEDFTEEISLV